MPVFCSSRLESSKDHTDKEGDTVDHMSNHIIDKKGWSFGIIKNKYLSFIYDLAAFYEESAQTKKEEIDQMEACKCLEQWI